MTPLSHNCPKCEGQMEQGFLVDYSPSGRRVSHWSAGQPKKSFFTGIKFSQEEEIPIGTFRCKNCGYLEAYARPEFGAS